MALMSSTLNHSLPVIVLLVVCPVLFVMVVIYYLVIYPLQKERRRKEKPAPTNAPPLSTAEAPQRDLHRWVPTLPLATPTTPAFSPGPAPRSPRSRESGHSFHSGSLIASQSAPSTRSSRPESRPISELDMLPISDIAPAMPLAPPPSAFISPHVVRYVYPGPQPQHLQDPFSDPDPDPFSDPGPSYVRRVDPKGTSGHASPYERAHARAHGGLVTTPPPPPAASTRSSFDAMSITTSSTLPPSYRTHRPTHRTASNAPFPVAGHGRRCDMAQTATGEHHGASSQSHQARSDRRSRHRPRKSVDGGVRLEGGPVDPMTGRGLGKPPRYRQKV